MYMLQPGDATRYVFGLANLIPGCGPVISGVGDGVGYFILAIMTGYSSGVAILGDWMVKDVQPHDLGYAKSHGMKDVNEYTLAACMLAASVLLDDPDNIEGACAAMLKAPELL